MSTYYFQNAHQLGNFPQLSPPVYYYGPYCGGANTSGAVAEHQSFPYVNYYQGQPLIRSGSSIGMIVPQTGQYHAQPNGDFNSWNNQVGYPSQPASYRYVPNGQLHLYIITPVQGPMLPFQNQPGVVATQQNIPIQAYHPGPPNHHWSDAQESAAMVLNPGGQWIPYPGALLPTSASAATVDSSQYSETSTSASMHFEVGSPPVPPVFVYHPLEENNEGCQYELDAVTQEPNFDQEPQTASNTTSKSSYQNLESQPILTDSPKDVPVKSHQNQDLSTDDETPEHYQPEDGLEVDIANVKRDEDKEGLPASSIHRPAPKKQKKGCAFCLTNKEPGKVYENHAMKDKNGLVTCPVLRKIQCWRCLATGDYAHTVRHCPMERRRGGSGTAILIDKNSPPNLV